MEFHFASRQDDVVLKHRQEWRRHGGTGTPACALRLFISLVWVLCVPQMGESFGQLERRPESAGCRAPTSKRRRGRGAEPGGRSTAGLESEPCAMEFYVKANIRAIRGQIRRRRTEEVLMVRSQKSRPEIPVRR